MRYFRVWNIMVYRHSKAMSTPPSYTSQLEVKGREAKAKTKSRDMNPNKGAFHFCRVSFWE